MSHFKHEQRLRRRALRKVKEPDLLIKAYEVARDAHAGQKRWGGEPYIIHPAAVAEMVDTMEQKQVAFLHDVVEDTDVTLKTLRRHGFSEAVLKAVDHLTHREGEAYYDYIDRLSHNLLAIIVKLADLKHNLSSMTIEKYKNMMTKYKLAELFLWERYRSITEN